VTPALGARERGWLLTLAIAAVFCWITFYAKGGLSPASMTTTEIALTLAAGLLVAVGAILSPAGRPLYGLWPIALLLAFAALTTISIVWSVQPEDSWQDSGRMFAYAGVFAAGVALARVAPAQWSAVLRGLTLAAVVICAYALLTKVFPSLDASDSYARVNQPYGYWNAVGLSAAIGVMCLMWLGARRDGHALARALAYPALALALITLVLAYSRGALVALALGLVLWFCIVPLRLRSATLLIAGALGAGAIVAWDFSSHALSSERVPIEERAAAGHELGALLVAMLVALAVAGIAIGFLTARRAPSTLTRRRAGALALAGVVVVLIAFAGALAHSHRGFTGTISHAARSLTDPNAKPPSNTPGRLTAVASLRARYWKEAFEVFEADPVLGAGAEGFATAHLRYEAQSAEVHHAHGFVVQTLADLGLVGLLLTLALALTWMAAAGRATHPLNRRRMAYTPERIGMLAMLCVVVTFGAHSLIDWTWYVPGDACVALLCAGWLAGRGPLHAAHHEHPPPARSYTRTAIACTVVVAAMLAAWSQWQPQRSEDARQEALAQLARHRHDAAAALPAADAAAARDPLSVEALFTLSTVQQLSGQPRRALATLERAVRLQPSNPQTWLTLARYQLAGDPSAAVKEFQAAIFLNPASVSPEEIAEGIQPPIELHNQYIQALEGAARQSATAARRFKSASGSRSRAASGAHRVAPRPPARRSTRSRTARAAP
jgi:O-antigen ligase